MARLGGGAAGQCGGEGADRAGLSRRGRHAVADLLRAQLRQCRVGGAAGLGGAEQAADAQRQAAVLQLPGVRGGWRHGRVGRHGAGRGCGRATHPRAPGSHPAIEGKAGVGARRHRQCGQP
ncbi:hypothetical protein G6F35_016095 [Rhizopus arrhizus]|nr:hypothetical protein G6F35_016095 [Rhizopus arrhizus]